MILDELEVAYQNMLRDRLDVTQAKVTALLNLFGAGDWHKLCAAMEQKQADVAMGVFQSKIDAYLAGKARTWREGVETAGTIALTELDKVWSYR